MSNSKHQLKFSDIPLPYVKPWDWMCSNRYFDNVPYGQVGMGLEPTDSASWMFAGNINWDKDYNYNYDIRFKLPDTSLNPIYNIKDYDTPLVIIGVTWVDANKQRNHNTMHTANGFIYLPDAAQKLFMHIEHGLTVDVNRTVAGEFQGDLSIVLQATDTSGGNWVPQPVVMTWVINFSSGSFDPSALIRTIEKIQSDIKLLQIQVNQNTPDIATLRQQVGVLQTWQLSIDPVITQAVKDINSLNVGLNNIVPRVSSAESRLNSIDAQLSAMNSKIGQNTSNIAFLSNTKVDKSQLQTYATTAQKQAGIRKSKLRIGKTYIPRLISDGFTIGKRKRDGQVHEQRQKGTRLGVFGFGGPSVSLDDRVGGEDEYSRAGSPSPSVCSSVGRRDPSEE